NDHKAKYDQKSRVIQEPVIPCRSFSAYHRRSAKDQPDKGHTGCKGIPDKKDLNDERQSAHAHADPQRVREQDPQAFPGPDGNMCDRAYDLVIYPHRYGEGSSADPRRCAGYANEKPSYDLFYEFHPYTRLFQAFLSQLYAVLSFGRITELCQDIRRFPQIPDMIIRQMLVKKETAVIQSRHFHPRPVSRQDAYIGVLYHQTLLFLYSQLRRRIMIDLRIRFAHGKLISAYHGFKVTVDLIVPHHALHHFQLRGGSYGHLISPLLQPF